MDLSCIMVIFGVTGDLTHRKLMSAIYNLSYKNMLQLLSLIAMEPPINLDTKSIRDEKIKVLRSFGSVNPKFIMENMVRGQYDKGTIGSREVPGYKDEVEHSWKFVDTIAEVWRSTKPDFPNYEPGTWGPKAADELLKKDDRYWWNI
jgi:glucose-6-phosphate 1-dehydrogenase